MTIMYTDTKYDKGSDKMLYNMTEVSELLGRDRRTIRKLLDSHKVIITDSYVSKGELIRFLKEIGQVVEDIKFVDGKLEIIRNK